MITPQTLRFKLDPSVRSPLRNQVDAQPFKLWRGNDTRIELGIYNAAAIRDLSNLASLSFEVDVSRTSTLPPLMFKTLAAADLDLTLTTATWDDETKQHAVFEFTATESNLDLSGAATRDFWMVIWGVTTLGEIVTLGYGPITFEEDNAGTAGTPDPQDPTYYTKDQADAVMQLRTEKGQADGYAGLDAGGKVPSAQLPAIALTETIEVADEAARLALTSAQAEGKIVVQIDTGRSYGLPTGSDPSVDGNWIGLGDRDIQQSDVVGLTDALDAKQASAIEAADTAARLALTGLTKGQVVHQLDEDRLYTYLGPDPSDAGDWIGGAKPSELLEHQILPQFTTAYYTDGTVQTNYAADASGITTTNLKAVWGGRAATSIGSNAFYNCNSLASADFPLVTTIGSGAFGYCESLTSADFPLVTSIGSQAFYYCASLTSADFPLVTTIGNSAFDYCESLTSADFPLATTIGNSAFYNCTSLTSVDFPLVTTIGNSAFQNCTLLTDLYLIAPLSGLDANALTSSSVTTIHLRPSPDTPAGWTEGSGLTIAGKTGVEVIFDWTTYPNRPA